MFEYFGDLLGTEAFREVLVSLYVLFENFIGSFFFMIFEKKKRYFWVTQITALCLLPFLALALGEIHYQLSPYFDFPSIIVVYLLLFLLVYLSYDAPFYRRLLNYIGCIASLQVSGRLFSIFLILAGKDPNVTMSFFSDYQRPRDLTIYWIFHIGMDILFGFVSRNKQDFEPTRKGKIIVLSLAAFDLILSIGGGKVIDIYGGESRALSLFSRIMITLLTSLILVLRAGTFVLSNKEQEVMVVKETLHQKQKQFENVRSSLDVINAKTHDLRHQLNALGAKITSDELLSLKEATRIYDSTIRTGNDVLDAALFEQQILGEKYGIRLSVMANGKLLSFLKDEELYSLISNALSNAIEAEIPLTDKEKKIIDFTLEENKGIIFLEVCNYADHGKENGKEVTHFSTKSDDSMSHGYGMVSMSYIVKEYGGELEHFYQDGLFTLRITFPAHEETAKNPQVS